MKRLLVMLSLLLLVAGCGGSREEFVFTGPPIAPPAAVLTGLTITPDYNGIVQGQTLQYTATAAFSNGTQQDVTSTVAWTSSNAAAASISGTGLATGLTPGASTISATLQGFTDTADLSVSVLTTAFALDATGTNLVSFSTATPGSTTTLAIRGLAAGDVLVGLDFRPQNNFLYGLGFNAASGDLTLYCVSTQSAPAPNNGSVFATAVGAANDDTFPAGTTFGFDFNPAVDRLRVVASNGQNRRLNPNTGTYVNAADGALNGGSSSADGSAYTNSVANASVTTLYALDSATSSIFIQNPPNDGALTAPLQIRDDGALVAFGPETGFDIPFGVNTATSNSAPAAGEALAALNVGGTSRLYSINLVDGEAHDLGAIGNGAALRGLALQTTQPGAPALALNTAGTSLVRFNTASPGTTVTTDPLSLTAGETLVGLDWRPATGQLIAMGVNPTTDTGTLYRADPQTGGVLTPLGGAGLWSLQDANNVTIDLPDPATAGYGFDFNPTVDRIRVTTSTGLNFRLNPVTGTAVDGNPNVAGNQPDGNINGAATGVSGAAYTNSFATAPTEGVTTLYAIDASTDSLFIQNPPNNGTEVLQGVITLGGTTLNFSDVNGFDIQSNVLVSSNNSAASGRALALLNVAGVNNLYSINLADRVATLLGAVNAARALAVGNAGTNP